MTQLKNKNIGDCWLESNFISSIAAVITYLPDKGNQNKKTAVVYSAITLKSLLGISRLVEQMFQTISDAFLKLCIDLQEK